MKTNYRIFGFAIGLFAIVLMMFMISGANAETINSDVSGDTVYTGSVVSITDNVNITDGKITFQSDEIAIEGSYNVLFENCTIEFIGKNPNWYVMVYDDWAGGDWGNLTIRNCTMWSNATNGIEFYVSNLTIDNVITNGTGIGATAELYSANLEIMNCNWIVPSSFDWIGLYSYPSNIWINDTIMNINTTVEIESDNIYFDNFTIIGDVGLDVLTINADENIEMLNCVFDIQYSDMVTNWYNASIVNTDFTVETFGFEMYYGVFEWINCNFESITTGNPTLYFNMNDGGISYMDWCNFYYPKEYLYFYDFNYLRNCNLEGFGLIVYENNTLEDCEITDMGGAGFSFTPKEGSIFRNNIFHNVINMGTSYDDVTFIENTIKSNHTGANNIFSFTTDTNGWTISDNLFYDLQNTGEFEPIAVPTTSGIELTNMSVERNAVEDYYMYVLLHENNKIISGGKYNKVVMYDCNGITIDGAELIGLYPVTIYHSTNSTIRNCDLDNKDYLNRETDVGITVLGSENIVLQNNHISGRNIGIWIYGNFVSHSSKIKIVDNIIEYSVDGIYTGGYVDSSYVLGNTIRDNTIQIHYPTVSGANNVFIRGNTFWGNPDNEFSIVNYNDVVIGSTTYPNRYDDYPHSLATETGLGTAPYISGDWIDDYPHLIDTPINIDPETGGGGKRSVSLRTIGSVFSLLGIVIYSVTTLKRRL